MYVQDRECVDEIIAMDPEKIILKKRKLRVQRCRTVPGQRSDKDKAGLKVVSSEKSLPRDANQQSPKKSSGGLNKASSKEPVTVPKGNPFLGKKLAGLSKEMRKQIKSTDKDRIARRLAKKKARAAMARNDVGIKESRPAIEKGRMRERKHVKAKDANSGKKKGKGRQRSDKALTKMNMKKS